jgi:hypothetical protein
MLLAPSTAADTPFSTPGVHPSKIPFAGQCKLRNVGQKNTLPPFLRDARGGEAGFRNVNTSNWPTISCAQHVRFIHETQIRAYLLDYLLAEVKDPGTPLLEECQCFRDGRATGFADYFIKLHGQWVPVEAKLNMLAEKDILRQVAKYMHIDAFRPTKGARRDEIVTIRRAPLCLIADQLGIYLVSGQQFVDCTPGAPLWKREHLGHESVRPIRQRLQSAVMAGVR